MEGKKARRGKMLKRKTKGKVRVKKLKMGWEREEKFDRGGGSRGKKGKGRWGGQSEQN